MIQGIKIFINEKNIEAEGIILGKQGQQCLLIIDKIWIRTKQRENIDKKSLSEVTKVNYD